MKINCFYFPQFIIYLQITPYSDTLLIILLNIITWLRDPESKSVLSLNVFSAVLFISDRIEWYVSLDSEGQHRMSLGTNYVGEFSLAITSRNLS